MADIRSFIAVEIDRAIIAALSGVQQQLRRTEAPVSWARPAGIHLTLKFLGDVPEERLSLIGELLTAIADHHSPFRLAVAGTGGFPTLRRPRVIWAGISDGAEALIMLAAEIDLRLAELGFAREARPFTPHLTLGRVKTAGNLGPLTALLEAHADEAFGEMPVTTLTLLRSELLPHGARYTALGQFPLLAMYPT